MAFKKRSSKKEVAEVEEKTENKALVNWEAKLEQEAKNVAAKERPTSSVISLRAGQMTYMGQPVPNNKLECIIVGVVYERKLYAIVNEDGELEEDRFDADNPSSPICFAFSSESADDMEPHEKSTHPQCEECDSCEWNAWGSSLRGGRGKACTESRRLMVIPADDLSEEAVSKSEAAMVRLPVTSISSWANYTNKLAATYKRPPWAMVTEISVSPNAKSQFVVNFNEVSKVPPEGLGAVHARVDVLTQALMVPYEPTVQEEEEEEPKPKTRKKRKF